MAQQNEGWVPVFSLDYMAAGNSSKHNRRTADALCAQLLKTGAATCSSEAPGYAAIGGRVGWMYETPDFYLGPSVGAYYGGPTMQKESYAGTAAGMAGTAVTTVRNMTFRFLLEDYKRFKIDEGTSVLLGAGVGLAVTHESRWCSSSGVLACVAPNSTMNRGFAAWEAGPSLVIHAWELGVRWAGFGRHGLSPWNTVEVLTGLRF